MKTNNNNNINNKDKMGIDPKLTAYKAGSVITWPRFVTATHFGSKSYTLDATFNSALPTPQIQ